MQTPFLINSLWKLWCAPRAHFFDRNLSKVEKVQCDYLQRLLRKNQNSRYGRVHGFANIRSYSEYQSRVPVVDYADVEDFIWEAAQGGSALTREKILLLEPTSGTQSGSKFIPYTATLRSEFQKGIAPWVYHLFRRFPELKSGTSYWSLSPSLTQVPPRESRVPIGFDSDSRYLGPLGVWMDRQLFSVPSRIAKIEDPDRFFYLTALHLLRDESLSLVSVWNPGFWTILLEKIAGWKENLLRDIQEGQSSSGSRRARHLESEWGKSTEDNPPWSRIWPRLRVISCWRDGWAKVPSERLQQLFPGVFIQPKGLIATEAFVSFPHEGSPQSGANLLAYPCHFFEFIDVQTGKIYPAWKLVAGETYSVVVTTGGGLYRYRLRDLVSITGFKDSCPILRFIAKEDAFSDLTGEKLATEFVQKCGERVLAECVTDSLFFLLAPEPSETPPFYVFYFYPGEKWDIGNLKEIAVKMDEALAENFHYRLCRRLGQLGAVRAVSLYSDAETRYYRHKSRNSKWGDVKWKVLEQPDRWTEILGPSG